VVGLEVLSTFAVTHITFVAYLHLPLVILSIVIFAFAIRSLLFLFAVVFQRPFSSSMFKIFSGIPYRKNLVTAPIGLDEDRFVFSGKSENEYDHGAVSVVGEDVHEKIKKEGEPTREFCRLPFISILVASYNEGKVIERLLSSISMLDYGRGKYEVIIIDDSTDDTPSVLRKWQKEIPCLKITHREKREGWKGGALNMGIRLLSYQSDIVLVVDADNVLIKDTLKQVAGSFMSLQEKLFSMLVVQGYPITTVYAKQILFPKQNPVNDPLETRKNKINNWVSRGISLRLSQRNLIEFVAKEKLGLPLPITGSLFAIKAPVLKQLGFSHDLCEDWDLTLEVYLSSYSNNSQEIIYNNINKSNKGDGNSDGDGAGQNSSTIGYGKGTPVNKKTISFDQCLVSFTEATQKVGAYFKQRVRVSEGHTRGFRRRLVKILRNGKLPLTFKIELIFMGLRYVKFIPLCSILIIDLLLLMDKGIKPLLNNGVLQTALVLQALSLAIYIIFNVFSTRHNSKNKMASYRITDVFYLLLLNICTLPAFVLGSSLGFLRDSGSFYRTARNT
jgi:cellulose synthase/poly-beta-1,6-N-acetylglucosamine synthase-like glycosyltransferase